VIFLIEHEGGHDGVFEILRFITVQL